jgi:hypothetical protein
VLKNGFADVIAPPQLVVEPFALHMWDIQVNTPQRRMVKSFESNLADPKLLSISSCAHIHCVYGGIERDFGKRFVSNNHVPYKKPGTVGIRPTSIQTPARELLAAS